MTEDFPWGEVVKLHNIEGLPAIVEYKVGPEFENAGKVEFHVTDLNCSFDSLDEALLGALCGKHGSEEALPYVVKLVYDDPATGVVSAKIRTSEAADRIFDLLQQGADGQAYKEAERYIEKHAPELYSKLLLMGAYMRELVISRLRDSSWYSNLFDECEGSPPLLETYTDTQLLDLYVQHC